MKIAIEGMDGVGKSTIAKMICDEYGYKFVEKPIVELFETDGCTNNISQTLSKIYGLDSDIVKAWFFGLGNIYTYQKHENEDLVIDRHFISNYFWNGSIKSNPVFKAMIDLIGTPDITVLLYASPETRIERIKQRDKNDKDLSDEEKQVFGYDKMINFAEEFNIPYVLINTENRTQEEVYEEVKKEIDLTIKKQCSKKLVKNRYGVKNGNS